MYAEILTAKKVCGVFCYAREQRGAVLGARVPCLHSGAGRQAGRQHKAGKRHKAACALLGVWRSCTILSLFAHHRAGGERRWSGSAIGAAWLSERAPIAQSGSDGRRKHRAQDCFILALLYSSAPCWLMLLGVQKRRRYSFFAGVLN